MSFTVCAQAEWKFSVPHATILLVTHTASTETGRSIMVVFAVWDRAARVRFPAPRTK